MGKKAKIGKQRKDKYYHLAKEAGYRSRAAFKLIQLNKRFEFLQNSRALVDLCAAPGGWLQVAAQNMPLYLFMASESYQLLGVDLVPIKAIPNCIGLQGDIREEKTRHLVKKELQQWEADCVLHDGAPNVGLNWAHDAFQQNCLTLYALRMATNILRKNGYFITKIFRSSDYLALIGVFEKLFKKVHVWKPAASRLESAEIFVVCEKYLKPARVDPDLLDIKKVFVQKNIEPTANPISMLTSRKKEKKKKVEGYEDGDITQFHELKASDFIMGSDPLLALSRTSCITVDDDNFASSKHTTSEIKECIRDIKVCGPAELRGILQWRKKILSDIRKEEKMKANSEEKPVETEEAKELRELEEVDELIRSTQMDEKAKLKKKKRRTEKDTQRLEERKKLKMVHKNDAPLVSSETDLFSLNSIRRLLERRKQIEENIESHRKLRQNKTVVKNDDEHDIDEQYDSGDDVDLNAEGVWETMDGNEENNDEEMDADVGSDNKELLEQNLVRDEETFMTGIEKTDSRSQRWLSKINDLLSDDDEEDELQNLDAVAKHMQRKDKSKLHKKTVSFADEEGKMKNKRKRNEDVDLENGTSFGGMGIEADEDSTDDDDDDVGPKEKRPKILTPMELALGEQMIYSAKKAKNLEEWGWNRYTNNDTNLPEWFVQDEKKHFRKLPPVAQKRVEYYQQQNRDLNVRPIKKVIEANARKQKRKVRRMEKAKKRAENILQNENMEHNEKIREMKKIYKRANRPEKKDVKYHVMTKGKRGRSARPNGPYRVVDKRLKKDKRGMQKANNKRNGGRNKPHPKKVSGRNKPRPKKVGGKGRK